MRVPALFCGKFHDQSPVVLGHFEEGAIGFGICTDHSVIGIYVFQDELQISSEFRQELLQLLASFISAVVKDVIATFQVCHFLAVG